MSLIGVRRGGGAGPCWRCNSIRKCDNSGEKLTRQVPSPPHWRAPAQPDDQGNLISTSILRPQLTCFTTLFHHFQLIPTPRHTLPNHPRLTVKRTLPYAISCKDHSFQFADARACLYPPLDREAGFPTDQIAKHPHLLLVRVNESNPLLEHVAYRYPRRRNPLGHLSLPPTVAGPIVASF